MAAAKEPVVTALLSTHDVRERVKILVETMIVSGQSMIARQHGYPEPNQEKISFHVGRVAAAQTFDRLLRMTPEEWDAEIETQKEIPD